MIIVNLTTHTEAYVTVRELADYWQVSRRSIYKQIEAGTLDAIRLGPRLYRIRTEVALAFERAARMRPDTDTADEAGTPKQTTPRARTRASGGGR